MVNGGYRFMNFVRNTIALEYYQKCLSAGIFSAIESKHPNIFELGKSLDSSNGITSRKNFSKNHFLNGEGLDGLVQTVEDHIQNKGSAVIEVSSSVFQKRDGSVDITRKYFVSGKTFTERCFYDTRKDFEEQELNTAIRNLCNIFSKYEINNHENIVLIKRARNA